MARGVNMVTLIGNLGADPETRHTNSGTAITNLRIATSEQWTDKQSGEKQERTEWHRVKLFGKLAEIAGEYLKKGRQVFIQGSLRTDKYTDKDGVERYATDIIATEMQMLGSGDNESRGGGSHQGARQTSGHGQNGTGGGNSRPAQGASGQRNQSHGSGQRREPDPEPDFTDGGTRGSFDDDIPFMSIPLRQLW